MWDHGEWKKKSVEIEEDHFNDRRLSRANKKKLAKAMRERRDAVQIGEVYGPGRMKEAASEWKLSMSTCYDLLTGWDLAQEDHRKAMWQALREEKPDFLIISPPCTAFSQLQAVNWGRMMPQRRVALLKAGLEHLQLAAAAVKWQLNRGGHILFEQPAGASSWKEPCIQAVAQRPEVYTIVNHQCQFGLNVDGLGPNKKPTRWMSSSHKGSVTAQPPMRRGTHAHTLQNGMPAKAAIYPPQLCHAIAQGIAEQTQAQERYAADAEEEEDEEVEGPPIEEQEDHGAVTEVEKKALMKVHKAVGHPQNQEFVRFLRAARVRGDLIRWVAQEFKRDVCQANQQPKVPWPTALLGVDLFYIPGPGGGNTSRS